MVGLCTMFSGIQLRSKNDTSQGPWWIDGTQEGLGIRSSDLADVLFSLFTNDFGDHFDAICGISVSPKVETARQLRVVPG